LALYFLCFGFLPLCWLYSLSLIASHIHGLIRGIISFPTSAIKSEESSEMEVEEAKETKKTLEDLSQDQKAQQSIIEKLTKILSGEKSIFFHLQVIQMIY
jgi:hypothetical protein